jgi:hypothetical protein
MVKWNMAGCRVCLEEEIRQDEAVRRDEEDSAQDYVQLTSFQYGRFTTDHQ